MLEAIRHTLSYLTRYLEHERICRWDLSATKLPLWLLSVWLRRNDHIGPSSPCCYVVSPAVRVFTRPHNKRSHCSTLTHSPSFRTKPSYPQRPNTTYNSGLSRLTMGSCGRCCRHPNKSPGRELSNSGAFLSACKNHQIFKKRPDAVILPFFCEGPGRCFIFTHRPSKGQRLYLAVLTALI